MAPELLTELGPAYRKLWRMLELRHGALETVRAARLRAEGASGPGCTVGLRGLPVATARDRDPGPLCADRGRPASPTTRRSSRSTSRRYRECPSRNCASWPAATTSTAAMMSSWSARSAPARRISRSRWVSRPRSAATGLLHRRRVGSMVDGQAARQLGGPGASRAARSDVSCPQQSRLARGPGASRWFA